MVVVGFLALVLTVLSVQSASAAIVTGRNGQMLGETRGEYLRHMTPELTSLLKQDLPDIRDMRIVDGPTGPRLDMPLAGCRDSMDCHQRFSNYLGLLVRMIETGKRRK
ncbi:unnamed protein product [Meganyctiphanes norvegica]|uniref:Uncharacterized protein n=1 Tax=Meganyctiphanes norvegica TaxID=48144 RepID=A0AAV2R1Y1_MEGNR